MLSSLGARRDRSRSPPEGHPPSKVFVQAKETAQHLAKSDVRHQMQRPNTKSDFQCPESFVPKIVVQEYMQEKGPSPPMPFTYAQALMQKRPESTGQQKGASLKQEAEEKEFPVQHQQPQQGQDTTQSVQCQEVQQRQEVQQQQQQVSACSQQQKQRTTQQQELHKYEVQQTTVTSAEQAAEVEQRNASQKQTKQTQETTVSKPALSSQELKSRKAKAMKNRPWLQKPASGEGPPEVQKQVSVQGTIQKTETQPQLKRETERKAHAASEPVAVAQSLPEEQVKAPEQTQQQQADQQRSTKEQGNSKKRPKEVKPHEMVAHPQQQLSQQEKQPKQRKQSRKQEHQQTVHIVKQSEISVDATVKSVNVTAAQLDQPTEAKHLPYHQTPVQSKSQAAVQEKVKPTSATHSVPDGQPPLRVSPATQVSPGKSQTKDHLKSQVPPQLQPFIPEAPQPSTQPQGVAPGLAVTQAPAWSQVRSPSPMQVSAQGQFPVSSHIQVRSQPQSWAPVRPPSPKPPQISAPTAVQSGTQAQGHFQSIAQPPTHSTSSTHSQAYVQSMPQTQAYAQQMAQQSHSSPLIQQTQDQFGVQPGAQHPTPFQSAVQHQGHISQSHVYSWNQVGAPSPMPVHYTSYPEGYSQSQAVPHQWIPEKTSQTQTVGQQGFLVSQQHPQQSSQAPKTESHPCWPQSGSQVDPQMGQHGYSHTTYSQSHVQMQNQPWAQTPAQTISGQISAYQQPAMRGYEVFPTQTHQSQVQQQPWSYVPPHMQPHSNPPTQSQQYSQHQTQQQSVMQSQAPFQLQVQIQPYPQPSPHAQLKTDLPSHSQKQLQHPGPQVQHLQKTQFQQPSPPQKPPSQFQPKQKIQSAQLQGEFSEQFSHQSPKKAEPASKLQDDSVSLYEAPKPQAPMPPQPKVQAKSLAQPKTPAEPPSEAQPPTQQKQVQHSPQPQTQSTPLAKVQMGPAVGAQSPPQTDVLQLNLNKPQELPQVKTRSQVPQTKPKAQSPPQPEQIQSQVNLLTQVNVLPRSLPESPDLCVTPPALAQAPPQAYTEAYTKAQALARNGFEEAKHCLQEHIRETINVFQDKRISTKQGSLNKVNAIIIQLYKNKSKT